jgi:hypothetical protein
MTVGKFQTQSQPSSVVIERVLDMQISYVTTRKTVY